MGFKVLKVLGAVYGTTTSGKDVTSIVQALIGDTIGDTTVDITVTNSTMGVDPDPGVQKSFAIRFQNKSRACAEGGTIALGKPPIDIHCAVYGTTTKGKDVTSTVQKFADNFPVTFQVNNGTMKDDPDHGVQKSFAIRYTIDDGPPIARACKEGDWISL